MAAIRNDMPTRREFVAGLAFLGGWFSILKALPHDDGYKPIGYLHATDPESPYVDKVTVDGAEIRSVFELNDIEGWARATNIYDLKTMEPMVARYEGKVRVTWKAR